MKTYRVGILGCRGRGTAAARAYHAHPRTEVVALCDLKPELLENLGGELGVSARFTDLDEMIRRSEPDIVAIPTGTEFHYDLCMRVLEHGVHIEVEKPICVDLEQADAVLKKAAAKGVRTAVHHQGRTGAAVQAISRALREGRIGSLRHIVASGKGYYGGFGLMNIGTHLLNGILELTGHCRRVTASALTNGRPITPGDVVPSPGGMGTIAGEHITATLEFDGNTTVSLLQHRFPAVDVAAYGFEVYGTEGADVLEDHRGLVDAGASLRARAGQPMGAAGTGASRPLRPGEVVGRGLRLHRRVTCAPSTGGGSICAAVPRGGTSWRC